MLAIRLFLLLFSLLLVMSCDTSAPSTPSIVEEPSLTPTANFGNFLQQLKQAEAGQDIAPIWSAAYIAPALEKDSLYPYLADSLASYQYGEVVYEDSSLVALSFYYKALHGRSLLAASFLATYDRNEGICLDMRPIFSSSTFDWSKSKGYQLGLSCQSTLQYIDNGSLGILQLMSKVRLFYTALEAGVQPIPNEVHTYQHVLQPNGIFATRLLSNS